jgi:hypothetical protein
LERQAHQGVVKHEISDLFLLALFADKFDKSNTYCNLTKLPVKHAGLALPNPVATSDNNYEMSTLMCSHLIAALQGVKTFNSTDHLSVRKTITAELKIRQIETHNLTLESLLVDQDCDMRRTILRGKETGQWLSVMPSTLNGMELSSQEFCDLLHMH